MPLVRAAIGTLLLLLAAPLALVGGGLAFVHAHRGTDGAYTATIERLHVEGRAVVVSDVDTLLRRDAPFARGGQTKLMISAVDPGGPLVVGLASRSDVEGYLSGVGYTRIIRVGLTHGALPVQTEVVPGDAAVPVAPSAASIWVTRATGLYRDHRAEDPLTWSPSAWRNAGLALVVMRADGSAGLDLTLRAAVAPAWLAPTAWGLLTLGGCLLLLGLAVLLWPHRRQDVMYVVEPDRVPAVAARLGVELPTDRPVTLGAESASSRVADPVPPARSAADDDTDRRTVRSLPVPPVRLQLALPRLSGEPVGSTRVQAVEEPAEVSDAAPASDAVDSSDVPQSDEADESDDSVGPADRDVDVDPSAVESAPADAGHSSSDDSLATDGDVSGTPVDGAAVSAVDADDVDAGEVAGPEAPRRAESINA